MFSKFLIRKEFSSKLFCPATKARPAKAFFNFEFYWPFLKATLLEFKLLIFEQIGSVRIAAAWSSEKKNQEKNAFETFQ